MMELFATAETVASMLGAASIDPRLPAFVLACAPMLALLVGAVVVDCKSRRIPNALCLALLAGGVLQSFLPAHTVTPGQSGMGALVGLALPMVMFVLRVRGAGDVKLQAGIGAWLGGPRVVAVFALASVAAMVLAMGQALCRGRLRGLARDSALVAMEAMCFGKLGLSEAEAVAQSHGADVKGRQLPYAVPLLVATLLVLSCQR